MIFHSDRGSQYTSGDVMALLARLGFRQSFSRVGMPGDNAWSESFFSILKKEAVHPVRFGSRDQAGQGIFRFIETFYNRTRIQKRLAFFHRFSSLNARFFLPKKSLLNFLSVILLTSHPKRSEYSEETKKAAIKAYYSGATGRGVGRLFEMSKANVYNWIKKRRECG